MESRRRKYRGPLETAGRPLPPAPAAVQVLKDQPAAIETAPPPNPIALPVHVPGRVASNDALLPWVRLEQYCKLSGDSPAAVHARIQQKKWTMGEHVKKAGGVLWVSTDAVRIWVENS